MNYLVEACQVFKQVGIPFKNQGESIHMDGFNIDLRFEQIQIIKNLDEVWMDLELIISHLSFPTKELRSKLISDGPSLIIAFQVAFSNWLYYEFPLIKQFCFPEQKNFQLKTLELSTPIKNKTKKLIHWNCVLGKMFNPTENGGNQLQAFDRSIFNLFMDLIPEILLEHDGLALFNISQVYCPDLGFSARVYLNGRVFRKGEQLMLNKYRDTPDNQDNEVMKQRFFCFLVINLKR